MSYSDDEDFNDIYGADAGTTETTTTNTNTGAATTTANDASGASNSEAQNTALKTSEGVKHTDASSASATPNNADAGTNVSNSLDQLAALQALSSNISQLTNNTNVNAGAGDSAAATSAAPASAPAVDTQGSVQPGASMGGSPPQQQQQGWGSMPSNPMNLGQQMPVANTNANMGQMNNTANLAPSKPAGSGKVDLSGEMSKMFVGGLNWETDEEAFKNYFSKYGEVVELKIMREENGRSRGFGFLTMDSPQAVDEVLKTRHILDGKVIDPKRAIPKDEQGKTGKIFVGGIPADVRPKEFEVFFAKYGTIIDAQLMLDKDTGRCRGFGFITYDSPEPVEEVCKTNFIDFNGRQVEVKRAAPRAGVAPKGQQRNQNNNNNNYNNGGFNNNRGGMNMGMQMGMNPMNPMAGMNPMGAGADAAGAMNNYGQMYNPQQMQEYWAKLQEYYQQYSQQTGMDYQQMMMMNPMMMNPMMGQQQPGMPIPGQTPQQQSGEADSVPTVAPQDEDEAQSGNTSQRGSNEWSDDRRVRGRGRRFDSDDNDEDDSGNNNSSANDGGNIGERRFQNRRRDHSPSEGSRNSRFGGYRDNYSQGNRNSGRFRRGGRGGTGANRGYSNGGGYRGGRSGYHPYRK